MAHFAKIQVVPGEKKIKSCGMWKSVPHHDGAYIPLNSPKSLSFLPSAALREDAGGDEHTSLLIEISKEFGAYSAPKGAVKDIGKAGMPLLGPSFTLRDHASKTGGILGGIHSLGGIPTLPRCGGLWWHNSTPRASCHFLQQSFWGFSLPKACVAELYSPMLHRVLLFSSPAPWFDIGQQNELPPVLKGNSWPLSAHNLNKKLFEKESLGYVFKLLYFQMHHCLSHRVLQESKVLK